MPDAPISTRLRPIIRVFVSSTFSDLKVERDALQQRVFQKLEQRCQKDGFQFQAIDLRWGVSTEAGLDHRTMRICFEELRRSQEVSPEPNFLILLGDRYGWRPLPEEISAEEYSSLEQAAAQSGVAGQTPPPADVLRRWYRRDENALTPVYVLQPRRKPAPGDPDGTDYTTAAAWQVVQDVLWQIINRAFPATGLNDRFTSPPVANDALPSIVRFQASATEQEIWCGALSVPNASQHVLAFFRQIDPPQAGVDAGPFRDFFDVVSGQVDPIPLAAQQDLKAAIKQRLGNNAVEMPAARLSLATDPAGKQTATISTDHLDLLCSEVETRLSAIIDRQIQEYWREAQSSGQASGEPSTGQRTARELEIERDEHFRFGRERGPKESFVGRQDQLQRILAYVQNDSALPLVIHGASGCGKTALLARVAQEIPAEKNPIVRFIGVTPRSSDLRSLLSSLCQELRQRYPIAEPLPADVRELIQEFRKNLAAATAEQPIILFLDALDQLSDADGGRQLFWIPFGPLPGHVKLIVSCLSDREEKDPVGQPYVALQRRNLPADNMLNLDALSLDDAKTLLFGRWLRTAGRTVNEVQRRLIEQRLQAEACRQPLYLKLLFEEARLWRSYDDDVQLNEPDTSTNYVTALLQQLFDRLSLEVNHGKLLVERALGYIAAARRGLTETEILEVLFADKPGYKTELDAASKRNNHTLPSDPPRIPIAIWSRLRSDLTPYLTERAAPGGNVLTLYHRQVAEWIKARFVDNASWSTPDGNEGKENPHGRLATFFASQDFFLESLEEQRARARRLPPTPRPANIRKVDELPWQLLEVAKLFGKDDPKSPHWDAVADLFTDLHFLEAKAEAAA